jgi:hypothetical protein
VNDGEAFEDLLEAVEPVKRPGRRGCPKCQPTKLDTVKSYDHRRCRGYLRRRGIDCRIARKGVESSEKLGRYR